MPDSSGGDGCEIGIAIPGFVMRMVIKEHVCCEFGYEGGLYETSICIWVGY